MTERGSIRVPVQLNGRSYWYQLDTGANATIAYGEEAALRGWAETGGTGARIDSIRLGGTRIGPARLAIREDMTPGATAGTVGLDLLLGHVVVLDFPRRRFCLVPGGDVPENLSRRVAWISARLHNGKIFVPIRIAGEEYADFFFDTGASAFPLTVDLDLWRRLTGRDGEAEATTRVVGSSWGQPMPFVGAPARGPVEIGTVRLERPVVYYRETDPDFFRRWPFPVAGLFGNVPFMDEVVVLNLGAPHLYGRWPAFGILRRSEELPDGP